MVNQNLMKFSHLVFSFLVIFQIPSAFLCILGSYLLVDTQGSFALFLLFPCGGISILDTIDNFLYKAVIFNIGTDVNLTNFGIS